ncbi:hypothetical protein L2E82_47608 [Cichorium intybus]|uniref:Uncharacterized protein n=1 Tax=Cichorium intybus TaxID=13427 RepID=A0ACB8YW90_CICIN|nr:hypothetical protein L2E82_47608 [Cichorium intybus]
MKLDLFSRNIGPSIWSRTPLLALILPQNQPENIRFKKSRQIGSKGPNFGDDAIPGLRFAALYIFLSN